MRAKTRNPRDDPRDDKEGIHQRGRETARIRQTDSVNSPEVAAKDRRIRRGACFERQARNNASQQRIAGQRQLRMQVRVLWSACVGAILRRSDPGPRAIGVPPESLRACMDFGVDIKLGAGDHFSRAREFGSNRAVWIPADTSRTAGPPGINPSDLGALLSKILSKKRSLRCALPLCHRRPKAN